VPAAEPFAAFAVFSGGPREDTGLVDTAVTTLGTVMASLGGLLAAPYRL
jgi:hypothetical protein